MNFDLGSFFIGVVVGAVVFFQLARAWVNSMVRQLVEAVESSTEKDSARIVPLRVEVENGQYLCYNTDSNEFVCQGKDVQELIDRFKQRCPGGHAYLKEGNEEVLAVLRAEMKQYKESKGDSEIK